MQDRSSKMFTLIKFQPTQILFLHRTNKKVYVYSENQHQPKNNDSIIQHACLQTGMIFNQGALYQKEETNLLNQIRNRRRANRQNYFDAAEIANTFIPLFQCLSFIHKLDIVHGSIHCSNIIIVNGEIKLRDWNFQPNREYYTEKSIKPIDDTLSLGRCLIIAITLNDTFQAQDKCLILQKFLNVYPQNIYLCLLIFLNGLSDYFSMAEDLLANKLDKIDDQLLSIYNQIKNSKLSKQKSKSTNKDDKTALTEDNNCNITNNNTQLSPVKKFAITNANKKIIHYENSQNKLQNHSKGEKVIKIIEKGSFLTQELMAKRVNEEKKIYQQFLKTSKAPIFGQTHDVENSTKKMIYSFTSSTHPGRNFSKKK